MLVYVNVKPKSKKEKIEWNEKKEMLLIWTKTAAEKGKVNKEIIKKLKKLLRCDVGIIKGHKSHNKIIEINLKNREKILQILQKL